MARRPLWRCCREYNLFGRGANSQKKTTAPKLRRFHRPMLVSGPRSFTPRAVSSGSETLSGYDTAVALPDTVYRVKDISTLVELKTNPYLSPQSLTQKQRARRNDRIAYIGMSFYVAIHLALLFFGSKYGNFAVCLFDSWVTLTGFFLLPIAALAATIVFQLSDRARRFSWIANAASLLVILASWLMAEGLGLRSEKAAGQ